VPVRSLIQAATFGAVHNHYDALARRGVSVCKLVEESLHQLCVQEWQHEPEDTPAHGMHRRVQP